MKGHMGDTCFLIGFSDFKSHSLLPLDLGDIEFQVERVFTVVTIVFGFQRCCWEDCGHCSACSPFADCSPRPLTLVAERLGSPLYSRFCIYSDVGFYIACGRSVGLANSETDASRWVRFLYLLLFSYFLGVFPLGRGAGRNKQVLEGLFQRCPRGATRPCRGRAGRTRVLGQHWGGVLFSKRSKQAADSC